MWWSEPVRAGHPNRRPGGQSLVFGGILLGLAEADDPRRNTRDNGVARSGWDTLLNRRIRQVHVSPLEIDLPSEIEKGEKLLQRAEEIARKAHQEIETELLQARDAGTAIVEEAERRGIDLIVIGLRYRKRFDQFYLGNTVMHVLKNSSCRVCVWREPIS